MNPQHPDIVFFCGQVLEIARHYDQESYDTHTF